MKIEEKIYLISKKTDSIINIPGYRTFFNLYGWDVFSIPKIHYSIVQTNDLKFFEITQDEAKAFKSFGDARTTIKVSLADDEEFDNTYENSGKVKVEVTESRYNNIIKMMKLFAKILLEEEFNNRYKKLNYDACELESRTWQTQSQEIMQYDLGKRELPFLNQLSGVYGVSLDEMVSLVKTSKKSHDNKVNELYLNLLEIKNKFKSATSIIDLNLLYTEYFNLSTPFPQEFKLQRPDLFNEHGRLIKKLGVGYNF